MANFIFKLYDLPGTQWVSYYPIPAPHAHGGITDDGKMQGNTNANVAITTAAGGALIYTTGAAFLQAVLGVSATAAELNHMDGVTSNVQNQFNLIRPYIASRGQNLLTNGTALLGDNTNFSSFTFDGSEANSSPGSFKFQNAGTVFTNEYMPVLAEQRYKMTVDAKTLNGLGRYYMMTACFDVDELAILAYHHMYIANTLTTLAQPLNNGDTVVYLTDATNWKNAVGSATHQRAFIFWDYQNSFGYLYPPLTYSRNVSAYNTWSDGAVDYVNNTITLNSAWAGGYKPAGTQLSNASSGGQYKYNIMSNTLLTTDWVTYTGYMEGVDYTGTNAASKFPPGTAKIKLGWLMNYQSTGETAWFTNMTVSLDYLYKSTYADLLFTPRNINGVPFDGSSNITVYDSTKMPVAGGTFTGTVRGEDLMIISRKFSMLEAYTTQYILLCRNMANNDVNGHIRIDRTSGNYQTTSMDVIVTSTTSAVIGGSLITHQYTQESEVYDLVTLTYNGLSYVAIRYVGNAYPYTTANFTGIHRTTDEANSFITVQAGVVTNVTPLSIAASKYTINTNPIFHLGNKPKLNEIANPNGNATFAVGGNTIQYTFTNPVGAFNFVMTGGWSDHVFNILDSSSVPDGNVGDHLMHLETARINVVGLHIEHTHADGVALQIDGKVGIGTGTPNRKLQVVSGMSVTRGSLATEAEGFYFDVAGSDGNALLTFAMWENDSLAYGFREVMDGYVNNRLSWYRHDNSTTGVESFYLNRAGGFYMNEESNFSKKVVIQQVGATNSHALQIIKDSTLNYSALDVQHVTTDSGRDIALFRNSGATILQVRGDGKVFAAELYEGSNRVYSDGNLPSSLKIVDIRTVEDLDANYEIAPSDVSLDYKITTHFGYIPEISAENWKGIVTVKGWNSNLYTAWQLIGPAGADSAYDEKLYFRVGRGSSWNTLRKIYHEGFKPTLADLSSDETHRVVTDDQITLWNSKLDSSADRNISLNVNKKIYFNADYGNNSVLYIDDYGDYIFERQGAIAMSLSSTALSVLNKKISQVVDPTSDQDAATKKYVDDNSAKAPFFGQLSSDQAGPRLTTYTITPFTYALEAGKSYLVKVVGTFVSASTSSGLKLGFKMSAGSATISGNVDIQTSYTAAPVTYSLYAISTTAFATGSYGLGTAVVDTTTPHAFEADFVINCVTAGSLNVVFSPEVDFQEMTIKAKSSIVITQLN